MHNIIEICKEFGFEIPADKQADFNKKVAENYRTKEDYDKVVKKRDEYKDSLDDVQTKLDGFKDVNVEDLKNQIATLTKDLSDEKAARAKDAAKVEMEKNVTSFLHPWMKKGRRSLTSSMTLQRISTVMRSCRSWIRILQKESLLMRFSLH